MAAGGHPRRYPGTRATQATFSQPGAAPSRRRLPAPTLASPTPGARSRRPAGHDSPTFLKCAQSAWRLSRFIHAVRAAGCHASGRPRRAPPPPSRRHRFVLGHKDRARLRPYAALVTDKLPAAGRTTPAGPPRDLGRENMVLRELVTVYRQLSGLALQDADLASVTQLLADRTAATVAVVSPVMDVMAAAAPGAAPEKAAVMVAD